jgi:hypothetical protein
MPSNSTIKLSAIVDSAARNGDVSPVLANGGSSDEPALSIANEVIVAMVNGGVEAQPMPWKWNRVLPAPFLTNSWQQDYATNNINIGWLESAVAIDVNSTSVPKFVLDVAVRKDLPVTYLQTGYPAKICWLYNYQLQYGAWGATSLSQETGLSNPGPNVVYTNPSGATGTVKNPITQIQDLNGNYWTLTTFGTCGSTQPTWAANPVYPTDTNPTQAATTQADGTCVWTAVNPSGQGFRLSPIPPQTGRVWQINVMAQLKPTIFTSLEQTLSPIPNEFHTYFKTGFVAHCYAKSPDPKIRAKFDAEFKRWMQSLDNAIRAGSREQDDYGFVPMQPIMSPGYGGSALRPDFPFGPPCVY